MTAPSSGFNADDAVHELSYRIPEKWGGDDKVHPITEPSSEQVARFWSDYVAMINTGNKTPVVPEGETDEARDERIKAEIAAGQHQALENLDERRRLLQELCSGDPTVEQLAKLPHRVLNAFEGYLTGAISPEA